MGLYSFLRRVPKKELEREAEARRISLQHATCIIQYPYHSQRGKYELAYWRGNVHLNKWMAELYRQKYLDKDHQELPLGRLFVILDEADILSLKLEMTFGSLMVPPDDSPALDRALRIIRNNRSYVYYSSSW